MKQDVATLCVHAGEERSEDAQGVRPRPLTPEIVQTSVFELSIEDLKRQAAGEAVYMYTRYANPTTRVAEEKIAALEGAEDCLITASGQAATLAAILATCSAGDNIVTMLDVYGGTLKLLGSVFERYGVTVTRVPYAELSTIERHFTSKTKLVVLESPTNPTLRSVDIAQLSAKAHAAGAKVMVDNTFATPVLQLPLQSGADLAMHSATKYLGGHSDLTAGALAGSKELIAQCRAMSVATGATLDPGASYLLIRGMKTLELRVERASQNAAEIARTVETHQRVKRVLYPGSASTEGHEVAKRQMSAFGAMLSLDLEDGAAAERFIARLRLWRLATSLGGVESTVSYPVLASHAGLPQEMLKALDITPGLVRLSVGIEGVGDLIDDLKQALE